MWNGPAPSFLALWIPSGTVTSSSARFAEPTYRFMVKEHESSCGTIPPKSTSARTSVEGTSTSTRLIRSLRPVSHRSDVRMATCSVLFSWPWNYRNSRMPNWWTLGKNSRFTMDPCLAQTTCHLPRIVPESRCQY